MGHLGSRATTSVILCAMSDTRRALREVDSPRQTEYVATVSDTGLA